MLEERPASSGPGMRMNPLGGSTSWSHGTECLRSGWKVKIPSYPSVGSGSTEELETGLVDHQKQEGIF